MITKTKDKEASDYLNYFKLIYQNIIDGKKLCVESKLSNCIIDFDCWCEKADGTGFANIWIQPKEKFTYFPIYSPIKDVVIDGMQLVIKTKVIDKEEECKHVRFELVTFFNPQQWKGRNLLNIQPSDKIVISGSNRTALEEDKMFSTYFLKYIEQSLVDFIVSSADFYKLSNR
jgi:hypothetical protein